MEKFRFFRNTTGVYGKITGKSAEISGFVLTTNQKNNIIPGVVRKARKTDMDNICKFIPSGNDGKGINIINFVYEKNQSNYSKPMNLPVYRAGLVTEGVGHFKTYAADEYLRKGDLFFEFPSEEFVLEADGDFKYIYISYLGVRANMLADKFGINAKNCIFREMDLLIPLWESAINAETSDLKCEAMLLYAFSELGDRMIKKEKTASEAIVRIKEYIDENFNMPDLDLKKIAEELSYNEKYISALFKREFKTGFSEYIATIRIQYACTLMNQGLSSVSDIATLCGYTDSLYFSKVFKKKIGSSPKEHIKVLKLGQRKQI